MPIEWKLKRVNQCAKCPWRKDADPNDIPHYDPDLHRKLGEGTIAIPGSLEFSGKVMACHEHAPAEQVHCVGWLHHQLGPGNNIPLRIRMISCANARALRVHGEQHERFEDTIPS